MDIKLKKRNIFKPVKSSRTMRIAKHTLPFILLISFFTSAISDDPVSPAIRGGNIITGFTGVVDIDVTSDGAGYCTGSMIGPNVLLTAAHCLAGGNESSGRRIFAIHYYDPQYGRQLVYDGPGNWIVDSNFDPINLSVEDNINSDIGIIHIDGNFDNTTYIDYLRIYAGADQPLRNILTAYGAGSYTYAGLSDDNLRRNWFKVESVQRDRIVVDTREFDGVCGGDSGGPLIYRLINSPIIPTITSVLSSGPAKEACSNNTEPNDNANYSRSNWDKLSTLMRDAGITCELFEVNEVSYRRCFKLPYIESVPYEGTVAQGTATATVITTIYDYLNN